MAAARRTQPSTLVSTGLSAATVALNVAGAATDAVPIVKQILNSAAHISAVAERIQKKREAMYTLVEKASIYATQINVTVAGRVLDATLQRRLERLFTVFEKIEALVEDKVVGKNGARARLASLWQKLIAKPNLAETLAAELDREIQLFQLVTGVQQTLTLGDVARVVAADVRYDGQFRLLHDCDVTKLDEICRRDTEDGVIVWASARVDGQSMVIRYVDASGPSRKESSPGCLCPQKVRPPYEEFIENIKKISIVEQSHRLVAQLYGYHVQGPHGRFSAFRAGSRSFRQLLIDQMHNPALKASKGEALYRLTVAFQLLEASWHLTHVHNLVWLGDDATIDEFGELRIGLFDDLASAQYTRPTIAAIFRGLFLSFRQEDYRTQLRQIDGTVVDMVILEHIRAGNGSDRLQRVWGTLRHRWLHVAYRFRSFPIVSDKLSLSPETLEKGLQYFNMLIDAADPADHFTRAALRGCSSHPPWGRLDVAYGHLYREYTSIQVDYVSSYDGKEIQQCIWHIELPHGSRVAAEVIQILGLVDGTLNGVDMLPIYRWNYEPVPPTEPQHR